MTNDTIKPGYYWANENRMIYVTDCCASYADTGEMIALDTVQIIAPALPPDQWPNYETMCAASDKVNGSFMRHAFEKGFKQCYKLFTGKDLE